MHLSLRKKPRAKSELASLVLKTKLMKIKRKMAMLGRRHFARRAWSRPWLGMEALSSRSLEGSRGLGTLISSTNRVGVGSVTSVSWKIILVNFRKGSI